MIANDSTNNNKNFWRERYYHRNWLIIGIFALVLIIVTQYAMKQFGLDPIKITANDWFNNSFTFTIQSTCGGILTLIFSNLLSRFYREMIIIDKKLINSYDDVLAAAKIDKIDAIFLRPFSFEASQSRTQKLIPLAYTLEEEIRYILREGERSQDAKFVAIGNPEDLKFGYSPFGAEKIYATQSNEWRTLVVQLLKKSHIAVMVVSETDNIGWELKKVREICRPEGVLLVIYGNRKERSKHFMFIQKSMGLKFPIIPPYSRLWAFCFSCLGLLSSGFRYYMLFDVISFDHTWKPIFIKGKIPINIDRTVPGEQLKSRINEFLIKNGINFKKPKPAIRKPYLVLMIIGFLLLIYRFYLIASLGNI